LSTGEDTSFHLRTWWIRQAITRSMPTRRVRSEYPLHMIETINKLMRVQKQLVQEYGREPTPDESGRRSAPASGSCSGVLRWRSNQSRSSLRWARAKTLISAILLKTRGRKLSDHREIPCSSHRTNPRKHAMLERSLYRSSAMTASVHRSEGIIRCAI